MKYFVKILLFCLLMTITPLMSAAEMRSWTGSNGRIIEAEVLALEGDVVKLKMKDGREMSVLLSKFAEKDQEIIKQVTATEDPFAEDTPAVSQADETPIKGPEIVRTIIEIDEKGNGKFRLEKTSELPKDDFVGESVTIPTLPKTPIKVKLDGRVKIVLDFENGDEPLLFSGWRYKIDPNVGELLLNPPGDNAGQHTHCLFGLPHGATKLPMRILVDTKTFQRDIVDVEWIFHGNKDYRSIVSCKVFCNADSAFEFECRWKNCKKERGSEEMQEIIRKTAIKLDKPFETTFQLPIPKEDLVSPIRFCLGRHLNARPDQKTDKSIVGYKRLELTAPLTVSLGFHVEEYGGKLIFVRDTGIATSVLGTNLGIREHDELRSINSEKVESAEDANKKLNQIGFCNDFAFETSRQGTTKIIRVFKKN